MLAYEALHELVCSKTKNQTHQNVAPGCRKWIRASFPWGSVEGLLDTNTGHGVPGLAFFRDQLNTRWAHSFLFPGLRTRVRESPVLPNLQRAQALETMTFC